MSICRVFVGKTGPFPLGRVFRVSSPVATVRFHVEPEPEPTREFRPVVVTSAVTAASRLSRTVAGAAAGSGSVCHSVCCMLLYSFALGVSALHVHGIHSLSLFII